MGTIGSVGSPRWIFEMESVLFLPNQRLGEKQPDQKEESKEATQMSKDFSAEFGTCPIEQCYLNCAF